MSRYGKPIGPRALWRVDTIGKTGEWVPVTREIPSRGRALEYYSALSKARLMIGGPDGWNVVLEKSNGQSYR